MADDAKNHPAFNVKELSCQSYYAAENYSFDYLHIFLNNEEAGNVYLLFFNIYDQGWLNPIT